MGGSHVGFFLSFAIFIIFLVFLYSILIEPIRTNQEGGFILEDFKNNILENVSLNLKVSSIVVGNNAVDCIMLLGIMSDLNLSSKIIIKNEFNQIQTAYVLGNDLEIVRNNPNDIFFKIYSSKKFEELGDSVVNPCPPESYDKGLVKVNEYIFEPNIINLVNIYYSDYENLKGKLGIPIDSDFGFGFAYNNGTIIAAEKDVTTNIYVEEIQSQYFDKNANILLGRLSVRVW